MSAYIVSTDHIDALLTVALRWGRVFKDIPLTWCETITEEEERAEIENGAEEWRARSIVYERKKQELTKETVNRVGCMLVAENRRSVNARYREDELEDIYEFDEMPGDITPAAGLSILACYEYQACEASDWEDTEAHAFCRQLQNALVGNLPGYKETPWDVNGREVFQKKKEAAKSNITGREEAL